MVARLKPRITCACREAHWRSDFHLCTQSKVSPSIAQVPKDIPTNVDGTPPGKDDSFHTPMVKDLQLSASLRAGAYDTNAKVLLTCSLPDLWTLFSSPPPAIMQVDNEEAFPSNEDINEEEAGEEEEEEEEEEEGECSEEEVEEDEEPVSKFEEENEGGESSGEEEEEESWSSSDDEEIHQLVQTLQSYVEESSMS